MRQRGHPGDWMWKRVTGLRVLRNPANELCAASRMDGMSWEGAGFSHDQQGVIRVWRAGWIR